MPLRLGVLLVAIPWLTALSPSLAAADPTVPMPIEDQPTAIGDLPSVAGLCVLSTGTVGGTALSFVDDAYTAIATALNPSACSCPLAGTGLISVSLLLSPLACSATVEISVVGSTGGVCPAPDLARLLCAPVTRATSPTSRRWRIPYSGCCIQEPAFVLVRISGLDLCLHSTGFVQTTADTCTWCLQYVSITNRYPTLTDYCVLATSQIWVSVEADCCNPTPTLADSWGRLKTVYR